MKMTEQQIEDFRETSATVTSRRLTCHRALLTGVLIVGGLVAPSLLIAADEKPTELKTAGDAKLADDKAAVVAKPADDKAAVVAVPTEDRTAVGSKSAEVSSSTRSGRKNYEVVVTRNIFNPDRGRRPPPPKTIKVERRPEPPKAERLVLTGTLVAENGNYGFFDGTKSDYRKVVRANSEIGGLKVIEITSKHASMQDGTNVFELKVGSEMAKQPDAPWKLSEGRSGFSSGGSLSSAGSGSSATQSSSGGAADEKSPALKALLEKLRIRKESGK